MSGHRDWTRPRISRELWDRVQAVAAAEGRRAECVVDYALRVWIQSGSKVDPKWIQSGSKVDPRWIQSGPTVALGEERSPDVRMQNAHESSEAKQPELQGAEAFQNTALDIAPTVTPHTPLSACLAGNLISGVGQPDRDDPALVGTSEPSRKKTRSPQSPPAGGVGVRPPTLSGRRRKCAALSTDLPVDCTQSEPPGDRPPPPTGQPEESERESEEPEPESVTKLRAELRYAEAWRLGIQEATQQPRTPVASKWELGAINRSVATHLAPLRGEALLGAITASARRYALESGAPALTPEGWEKWLNNGCRTLYRVRPSDVRQDWMDKPIFHPIPVNLRRGVGQ